jgi:glycosyltransferase involved in cell wall biosynthesis
VNFCTEPDISIIVTFHREKQIANWMLENMKRLRAHADKSGLSHELICILDMADDETHSIVANHRTLRPQDNLIRVANGDLGTSRNDGVASARGPFVATFDGDDYHSANWLTQAHAALSTDGGKRVVHPEFVVSFGASHHVMKALDQDRDFIAPQGLLTTNPWCSSVFTTRELMSACPYQSTRTKDTGFGFEDWHWNLEMLARGVKFVTAQKTALYYRRKPESLLVQEARLGAIVRSSDFFHQRFDGVPRI